MQQYPSLDKLVRQLPIHAYDKLDGSNIRAEWTRKGGFQKFGTRHRLLDPQEPILGEAVGLFQELYSDDLSKIFRRERLEKATAFFEFYGPNSFAGFHEEEPHEVRLFDVHVHKQGLLEPRAFNKLFAHLPTAELLYSGKPTQEFLEAVRGGELPGMTFEGVICKGGYDARRRLVSFKVKNEAWLQRLKLKYAHDEAMFEKLA